MTQVKLSDFMSAQSDRAALLLQNDLYDDRGLFRFAKDRGLRISRGDPETFRARKWLRSDAERADGTPLYHPFRIYPIYWILFACDLHITPSSSVDRERFLPFVSDVVDQLLQPLEAIHDLADEANGIVDLPIILEPIYWPRVTGRRRLPGFHNEDEYRELLDEYRSEVEELLASLETTQWAKMHERLRMHAASLDQNEELYLLLRLSPWDRRKKLKGHFSAALWFRHMAEVIRLAFEEHRGVEWPEEDRAYGSWMRGARVRSFGSERPLDKPISSRSHIAFNFGLHTGSVVTWYLEGHTEFGAVSECLPGAPEGGIELVNLKGSLETKASVALRFADSLQRDRRLRRFSVVSIDLDETNTVRTVRQQVRRGRIVGFVAPNDPDFEFANFTLDELVEVAAQFDEDHGHSGAMIRSGTWEGVVSGREFEERYLQVSERGRSLKGEDWGRALARYALQNPTDPEGRFRPFLETLEVALRCRTVKYEYHAATQRIDPETFELVRVEEPEGPWGL